MSKHNQISSLQHAGRILLGLFMLVAGVGHFTFGRQEFQAQVPNWLSMEKDQVVLLSGIVEIALALFVLFLGHRSRIIPWLLAIFFVVIFPGNWSQYVNQLDGFALNTDAARLLRLFFQPLLILWALWSMGIIGRKKSPQQTDFSADTFPIKLK